MRVVYLLLCMLFSQITWANDSDLMLLGTYENQDIQGWVMSEKLDGVRGYWDGERGLIRNKCGLKFNDLKIPKKFLGFFIKTLA